MKVGPLGELTAEEMDRLAREFGAVPNVRPPRYHASVDPQPVTATRSPFPVDPADVPADAVRAVRRTLLRHPGRDVDDDELARLVVAVVIAALRETPPALS